jgi:hypothetical protein
MENWFFDTFGYITVDVNVNKNEIIEEFEQDIQSYFNLPSLNGSIPVVGINNRENNIRFSNFLSDKIYSIFYNPLFLDEIYKLTNDFFILSPMESFHLTKSAIHRDYASELKQLKVLFYLDDLSSQEKGPLYILPGTQNLYDKYSSSVGENVAWPNPQKGAGGYFCNWNEKLNNLVPKTYLYSNADKIVLFNTNLFHASDGNLNNPNILRRCIGMTLMCADRSNETLMNKISNYFKLNNIDNSQSNAYKYCKKNNLTRWLKHFYIQKELNKDFKHSEDFTDSNEILFSVQNNRWRHYLDYFSEPDFKNKNSLLNCFDSQAKVINSINLKIPIDCLGI